MIPMPGDRFGRGTIIRELGRNANRRRVFELRCDCGKVYAAAMDNIKGGGTKSCGCLKLDSIRINRHPNTMPYGVASFYNLLRHYKIEASKRNLLFSLSEERFAELTKQNCFYCGTEPATIYKRNHGNGEYIYNGLDRLDNNLGYEEGNAVPCCKACNFAKHTMSFGEFKEWVTRVYNHISAIQDIR